MRVEPLELSPDFQAVLNLLEKTDLHYFVTGRAGTGKSTLLQLFRNTTRKKTVVLAPTGIAALNVRGQTIHSFFGFPPRIIQPQDIMPPANKSLYRNLEVIVIDEISMVRADIIDGMDIFLRRVRRCPEPFGGVQMLFFGDLFQLPPVVAGQVEKQFFQTIYPTPYFFSANILQGDIYLEMVELQKIYRQEEKIFIRLLDAIRTHAWDHDDLEMLNTRYNRGFSTEERYITLCSINASANAINQKQLAGLQSPGHLFQAHIQGTFHPRMYPTEPVLKLKKGAQVMLIKNDPMKRFVNGSLAVVEVLEKEKIVLSVEKQDGTREEVELEKFDWEILKYRYDARKKKLETDVVGMFRQYPLRLAWAITIHKSQGKTFDRVVIDLGRGAFEYGQTYVALSRCRTLEGIVLRKRIKPGDILVDPRILAYYDLQRRYLPGG